MLGKSIRNKININREMGENEDENNKSNICKTVVSCRCGELIDESVIDYWNGCNEEGSEYGRVTADCKSCGKYWEASQWGEWEDKNEAMNYLNDYILGKVW